jgi:hypothetical protein
MSYMYVRGANCPWGEISVGRIVRGAKCPWGVMSVGRDVVGRVVVGRVLMGQVVLGRVFLGRVVREPADFLTYLDLGYSFFTYVARFL